MIGMFGHVLCSRLTLYTSAHILLLSYDIAAFVRPDSCRVHVSVRLVLLLWFGMRSACMFSIWTWLLPYFVCLLGWRSFVIQRACLFQLFEIIEMNVYAELQSGCWLGRCMGRGGSWAQSVNRWNGHVC